MASITLYLDSEGMTAYQERRGISVELARFHQTPADQQAFKIFLQDHRRAFLSLLVNLPQEQSVMDSIPQVGGKDRKALIERRLHQHFPDTPLRLAEVANSPKPAPGKISLRLSAFPQQEAFSPWLTALSQQHSRLTGIYSVSQLNASLLEILDLPCQRSLLFIRYKKTLQQYFIEGRQTHLSRHLPWPENDPDCLQREAGKLQQFLINQHQIPRDEKLAIYALGFSAEQVATPSHGITFLSPARPLAELYLKAFKTHRPGTDFAPPERRQAAKLARLRLSSALLTAAFTLCSLAFAVSQQAATAELEEQTLALRGEADKLETQPRQDKLADTEIPINQLRLLTQRHASLMAAQQTPQDLFLWLSHALDQHPAIDIEQLEWRNNDGQEWLRIEGNISNHETNGQAAGLEAFIATLSVDRKIPLRSTSPGNNPQAVMKGSSEKPFKAPVRQTFVIETGAQP